jgi:Uma2 family endonuclease
MMTQAQEKKIHTPEEYLAFEINSDTRHEYINEEIIPMTGGTPEHNEIASILNAILRVSLKGQPYSIFIADQRLWIPDRQLYTYPDVMVAQRPIELQTGCKDTIINPIMIAEVLSKSTKSYDRDEKFSAYRTISTFQEYLLIDQYALHVERYFKADSNQWIFSEYNDIDARVALASIPCEISLADLYSDIEFEAK